MRKLLLIPAMFLTAFSNFASAHCPVCALATGAAVATAKYYGLDVSIVGLFLGALGISTGLWLGKKIKRFVPIITLAGFLLTVIPTIYLLNLSSGDIERLVIGSVTGGIISILAYLAHLYVKKVKGKVLIPYQGVVFTIAALLVAAIILNFIMGV